MDKGKESFVSMGARSFWRGFLTSVDSNYEFMQIEIRLASIHDLDRPS